MTRGRKFDATQRLGVGGRGGCKNFDASVADCAMASGGGRRLPGEIKFPERRRDGFDDFRMFPRKFSPRFLGSTRFRWFVHIAAPPFVCRGRRICTRRSTIENNALHASSSSVLPFPLAPVALGHFFRRDSRPSNVSRRRSTRILAAREDAIKNTPIRSRICSPFPTMADNGSSTPFR